MIMIIDYGAGNLRSIQRAIEATGLETTITSSGSALEGADAVVLPGVGNAGHAMEQLDRLELREPILRSIDHGTPFLGICVGMQVLFQRQEEGNTQGLGVLPGEVRRLPDGVKLPHIGWNRSTAVRAPLTSLPNPAPYVYFVHSFVPIPADESDIAATAHYGRPFASVVIRDHVWGTQFHPEKSGSEGLDFLRLWAEQVKRSIAERAPGR